MIIYQDGEMFVIPKKWLEIHDKQIRAEILEKLEEVKSLVPVNRLLDDIINDKPKELGMLIAYDNAIEIVKKQMEKNNEL